MAKVITFTTDFGNSDPYVAVMKGVVLGINPAVRLVDISHEITPQDVMEGAFVLAEAYPYFPEGSIHIGVVDPGVGSSRRPILMVGESHFFVGPDNGLFTLVAKKERVLKVIELRRKRYFLKPLSRTFHGRDIFSPVAAHLSLGIQPDRFGPSISDMIRLQIPEPVVRGGEILGQILHTDRFGNGITTISVEAIDSIGRPERCRVVVRDRVIEGIRECYEEVAEGEPLALVGSSGLLEISVNRGDAARIMGFERGDPVRLISGS